MWPTMSWPMPTMQHKYSNCTCLRCSVSFTCQPEICELVPMVQTPNGVPGLLAEVWATRCWRLFPLLLIYMSGETMHDVVGRTLAVCDASRWWVASVPAGPHERRRRSTLSPCLPCPLAPHRSDSACPPRSGHAHRILCGTARGACRPVRQPAARRARRRRRRLPKRAQRRRHLVVLDRLPLQQHRLAAAGAALVQGRGGVAGKPVWV